MRKFFIVLLSLNVAFLSAAQNNLPPVYEIRTDTAINIVLDNSYYQMLEDREGKWTIKEVSNSPIADKFHLNTTKAKGVDYSINTFWFRYHFKNNMDHEARIAIPEGTYADYVEFYTLTSNGQWNQKITGAYVPWSKRNDLKSVLTVTYVIPSGEELLIYERHSFDYFIDKPYFLGLSFGFTDKVMQHHYNNNDPSILRSFLFGLLFLAA